MNLARIRWFFAPSSHQKSLPGKAFRLALLTICAVSAGTEAFALDDVDFKPSGEFRSRYFNDINSTGLSAGTGVGVGQRADTAARLTTNILARKGETLQVFGSFLYNLQFGANNSYSGTAGAGPAGTLTENNTVLVNRAWGLWKVTNSVIAKVGRLGLEFGDGSVFSENTWQRVPTEQDGFDVIWDIDVVKLRLIGVKTHEYSVLSNLGSGGVGPISSFATDPERNFYGISADIRNLPVFMKAANVHGFQINSDPVADTVSSRGRDNWQHYGVSLNGDYAHFGYHIDGAYQTGHVGIFQAASTTSSSQNLSANMLDIELNYTVPDWYLFKVAIGGHRDSGSDHSAATRTYQPLYYDRHKYAGFMDVVGWGNLTYGDIVFTITPREEFVLGVGAYVFSRTQNATDVTFGNRYSDLTTDQTAGQFNGSRSLIGTEIDAFAERTFEGSFKLDAHATVFIPGAYLRDGSVVHNRTMAQIMLEGTLPF